MPDYNLGHDEKTIIFMFPCEPMAHVDSRLAGILLKTKKDSAPPKLRRACKPE
jgi:hypothetical protein